MDRSMRHEGNAGEAMKRGVIVYQRTTEYLEKKAQRELERRHAASRRLKAFLVAGLLLIILTILAGCSQSASLERIDADLDRREKHLIAEKIALDIEKDAILQFGGSEQQRSEWVYRAHKWNGKKDRYNSAVQERNELAKQIREKEEKQ